VANLLSDRIGKGPVRYGFLAQSGPIVVKLTASGASAPEALEAVERERAAASERLGALLYAVDDETMEEVVGRLLREAGKTLAVAESLTAGMVFLGGVVTYSMESKREVLGISDELLADGAVSTAVAEAMAESVRRMFGSDIAVSTTGVAGPGQGGESKPTGTACVALAHPGGVVSLERRLPGYRQMVRNIATMAALNAVRLYLQPTA
jgi:PncC family amidohydrolase